MVTRTWSSSRLSCGEGILLDATGMPGILSRPRREWSLPLELGGGIGAPLDVDGTLVLPLEWLKVSVAFPPGFLLRVSHMAVPRATVVWVDPRLESRGSAGKTSFTGMD